MFNLNFTNNYDVIHINNELGNKVIGGAGTYMNEMYTNRDKRTGFIYINLDDGDNDVYASDFLEQKDILILNKNEIFKLSEIKCKILVVHFYEFATLLTKQIVGDKKIVYVIHSVPLPEPPIKNDPFGGNYEIRDKFLKLCDISERLICVSYAEKQRMDTFFPEYRKKVRVIYNGINVNMISNINNNYLNSRKIIGYIGRTDYRKGIIEFLKEVKDIDVDIMLACPKNDSIYVERILEYIDASGMKDRVRFCGWCLGERKDSFFRNIDALIIPSLYEPFGYVALEAMKNGIIVLSSSNGGLGEILKGYRYLFNPYIKGEIKQTVIKYIEDDLDIIKAQQNFLIENVKLYSSEHMVDEYNRCFKEMWE